MPIRWDTAPVSTLANDNMQKQTWLNNLLLWLSYFYQLQSELSYYIQRFETVFQIHVRLQITRQGESNWYERKVSDKTPKEQY